MGTGKWPAMKIEPTEHTENTEKNNFHNSPGDGAPT